MMSILAFIAIGIISGVVMGFFGIAGGIVVVPGLMYLSGFSQKMASGTNLLVLLVPMSFAAAIEYYRAGNTNIKAAIIIAAVMCISAWFSSHIALKINAEYLRLAFGLFVILMGIFISATTIAKMAR
jgi:Sulfite exporter TauE/SafE.